MAIESKRSFAEVAGYVSYAEQLPVIGEVLTRLCGDGDTREAERRCVFEGKVVVVSVNDYLVRLCKYGHCSKMVFILMFIYLKRLLDRQPEFIVRSTNVHRLLIALFVVAAKYHDDHFFSNHFYSKVGGIANAEINRLEITLLEHLTWDLYVSPEEYRRTVKHLTPKRAKAKG
eukprot:TRINITY_DN11246_c1_g1_i1.p1 TRINITY_DN11246_c1_g1~~TRINITY_DN11246_c1_g1_i1.p1  ORF type:complete len:173 (+),score=36.31 TRINITY_DN11246_c1_g1_i1:52-570(+)